MRPNRFVRVVVCAFMRKAPRRFMTVKKGMAKRASIRENPSRWPGIGRNAQSLPPRSANPPSSVGEPSLLGRRTLPPRSAKQFLPSRSELTSSVGEAVPPFPVGTDLLGRRSSSSLPGRVRPRIRRHVFSGRWSVLGRPSDGLRFAGGGGGADRWSRGNAQERRRTRKMQKIICENIDKIR